MAKMGKVREDNPAKLTDFKLLSFDVYSTLIDEKSSCVLSSTVPLLNLSVTGTGITRLDRSFPQSNISELL